MTDAELIARLRNAFTFKDLRLCPTAADRIEALTKERDTAREYAGEVRIREKVADDARIEAEAKLAKAVEVLEWYAYDDGPPRHRLRAQKTLAEIKGESHD